MLMEYENLNSRALTNDLWLLFIYNAVTIVNANEVFLQSKSLRQNFEIVLLL